MTAVVNSTGKEAGCSPSDSSEFEGLFLFEWQAMNVNHLFRLCPLVTKESEWQRTAQSL